MAYTLLAMIISALSPSLMAFNRSDLAKRIEAHGQEQGLSIRMQREDIFIAMHRI